MLCNWSECSPSVTFTRIYLAAPDLATVGNRIDMKRKGANQVNEDLMLSERNWLYPSGNLTWDFNYKEILAFFFNISFLACGSRYENAEFFPPIQQRRSLSSFGRNKRFCPQLGRRPSRGDDQIKNPRLSIFRLPTWFRQLFYSLANIVVLLLLLHPVWAQQALETFTRANRLFSPSLISARWKLGSR